MLSFSTVQHGDALNLALHDWPSRRAMTSLACSWILLVVATAAEARTLEKRQTQKELAELYQDQLRFDSGIPDSFKQIASNGNPEGFKRLTKDGDCWLIEIRATGFQGAGNPKPNLHHILMVDEDAQLVQLLTRNEPAAIQAAKNHNQAHAAHKITPGLIQTNDTIVLVDGNLLGNIIDDGTFSPFRIRGSETISVVPRNSSLRDEQIEVRCSADCQLKIVDLKDRVLFGNNLFEKYYSQILVQNLGEEQFRLIPAEFGILSDRDDPEGIVENGINFDRSQQIWIVSAKGEGWGQDIGGVSGRRVRNQYSNQKLLIVPNDCERLELVGKDDRVVRNAVAALEQEDPELAVDFSRISKTDILLVIDGRLCGESKPIPRTSKRALTPYLLDSDTNLTVVSNHASVREEALSVRQGVNPLRRLDLMDYNAIYDLETANEVRANRGGYALDSTLQETYVVLHGRGLHKALMNRRQAFQTSNIGIAEVVRSGLRNSDALAYYVGTSVVTGGFANGDIIIHNIMSDIAPREENYLSETKLAERLQVEKSKNDLNALPDVRLPMKIRKKYGAEAPSFDDDLGRLELHFDRMLAATITLGSRTTPESIEAPVTQLGASPVKAAAPIMQVMLWGRNIASTDGKIGGVIGDLQKLSVGSFTLGRFADNHINNYLKRCDPAVQQFASRTITNLAKSSGF